MKNYFHNIYRQQGVAVITAVLVLAIAATAATTITANYQLDMRRTENAISSSQAWAYAKGAEQWTMAILARDAEDGGHDSLDEDWAIELPPFELPGGYIVGKIEDAQGKLNLNQLWDGKEIDPIVKTRAQRLFKSLEINPDLVHAIIDYIDPNQDFSGTDGAERDIYIGLETPYLPADQYMSDISELRLVHGIDQEMYDKLIPHVTALPISAALNLNTASAEVLACLDEKISLDLAKDLIKDREDDPYKQPADFSNHALLRAEEITVDIGKIGVSSKYFDLKTMAIIGNSRVRLTSTVYRRSGKDMIVYKRSQKF